jgi:type III restriction enzyme
MHDHGLKDYQKDGLKMLEDFCNEIRLAWGHGGRPVYDAFHAITRREYLDVPQMPNVPYVCLRVPTGGGKTLIAAHAVGTIAKRLGHADWPLALWVAPSTPIRDQTLQGLRDRDHPYHRALKESLVCRSRC